MRGAGQAPHLPLPEIAGSPHGTEQGWAQLSVLLGTQLHIRRVPRFIDENTEVQRKEDLVFRDRGCGWRGVPAAFPGAHKALLGKVLSPLSGFIHPLVQPPLPPLLFWSPPGSSGLSTFELTVPCTWLALSHVDDAC